MYCIVYTSFTHVHCAITIKNKFALLWGEAQKKIAYCYPYPNVNYSDLKVTYSYLR